MILWTIQPLEILDLLRREGCYRCDPEKGVDPYFLRAYDWLAGKMAERIGPPPEGVRYPVWAWYRQNGRHRKPDLRSERWCYGYGGMPYVCMELSIPSERVVLSDFDEWHCVLNDILISDTEEENDAQESYFAALSPAEQVEYKSRNWERVFDVKRLKNDWVTRGDWVQATFWELRTEDVRKIRYFTTAYPIKSGLKDREKLNH